MSAMGSGFCGSTGGGVGPLLGAAVLPVVAGGAPGGCEEAVLLAGVPGLELVEVPDCEPVGNVMSGGTKSASTLPLASPGWICNNSQQTARQTSCTDLFFDDTEPHSLQGMN